MSIKSLQFEEIDENSIESQVKTNIIKYIAFRVSLRIIDNDKI